MGSGELEYWRNYFKSAKSSIIKVIENAVMVAALDCPDELKLYRGRIAEKLYSQHWSHFFRCDHGDLVVPRKDNGGGLGHENKDRGSNGNKLDDRGFKNRSIGNGGKLEGGGTVETKVDGNKKGNVDRFMTPVSIFSVLDAEALSDEIDEEKLTVGEVLRIKEVLDNSEDQSDTMLFESLRKLQLMALSMDILKATEIGKIVNRLCKHRSKRICRLARTLLKDWRKMVDECMNATPMVAATENFIDSVNPSLVDIGQGLPLPPLDMGAFFTSSISRIELSQFYDGMDDDGNPQSGAEFNKNHDKGKKHSPKNNDTGKQKSHLPKEANVILKDKAVAMKQESAVKVTKKTNTESSAARLPKPNSDDNVILKDKGVAIKQESVVKVTKKPNTEYRAGSVPKPNLEKNPTEETKFHQNSDTVVIQKTLSTGRHDNFKFSDKAAAEEKLEAARRKLLEGYQQAKNAKNQRTIQLMDLHELPKQELGHRNIKSRKQKNHSRRSTNG